MRDLVGLLINVGKMKETTIIVDWKTSKKVSGFAKGVIYVTRHNPGEFEATLLTSSLSYITSNNPAKFHKNSKEALIELKRNIENYSKWIEGRIKIIDKYLKK